MEFSIRAHFLYCGGRRVPYCETPNRGGILAPRWLVVHYTAGASFESSVAWLRNPAARASAHLVIARDGRIAQLAPFNVRTWHAGPSFWRGVSGLNACSVGIEFDNAGRLTRAGGEWRTAFGAAVPAEEVAELRHRHESETAGWQRFPEAQLEVAARVAETLCREYALTEVLGHDDIAPGRKFDPGPAFPMADFRSRAFGGAAERRELRTTVALRIRSGPGVGYPEVAGSPLAAGTLLGPLEEDGEWIRVTVRGRPAGWVSARYVAPA